MAIGPMVERGLIVILWLMPFVRLEPAPVDFLIWVVGGFVVLRRPRALWEALPPPARAAVPLLLASHLSLLWAPDLGRAGFYTLATLEMGVLLALFAHEGTKIHWGRLARAYIGGSALAAALGALAFFGPIPYRELFLFGEMRAMALFQDPNVFGAHLVPAVILLWSVARPRGAIEGGAAFLLTLGVLLSGSRTAWGGLLLGLTLWLLLLRVQRGAWTSLFQRWTVAVGMLLALAMSFHPQVSAMLQGRAVLVQDYDYERFYFQNRAISGFVENPLGLGPGQSEEILGYATHNLYLRVLYELGILGGLGLAFLLGAVGARLWKGLRAGEAGSVPLVAVCLALLSMSFFIDSLHWRHLFVFLGLALAGSGAGAGTDLGARTTQAPAREITHAS